MYNAWTYQLQALSNFHQAKMSAGGMMLEPNKTGISWTIFLLTQEIKALKKGSDPSGMAEAAYTAKAQAEAAAQDCHAASLRAAACAESSEGTSLMTEIHALRQAQAEAQMKGAQLDEQLAQLASQAQTIAAQERRLAATEKELEANCCVQFGKMFS